MIDYNEVMIPQVFAKVASFVFDLAIATHRPEKPSHYKQIQE